jgi:small-conductance mechanosensitive channel
MTSLSLNLDVVLVFIKVGLIVVAGVIITTLFNRFIHKIGNEGRKGRLIHVSRFFQLIVYSIVIISILWSFNIDVTGLIAGLGVGALILGFALKEIIENWVSGLIIISGKTYSIGDVITVSGLSGVVTDISLRTTRIKTYDNNEIIIPNSTLLKDNIINHTSGKGETVSSLITQIDYIYDVEQVKTIIEQILTTHPNVIVDTQYHRVQYITRIQEWTTTIETLFWINKPEHEFFIKSTLTEAIKQRFEEENILPPIPSIIRKEYLQNQKS